VIDRWYSHPGYIASVVDTIERGLSKYDAAVRDKVCIVFSAHSLPIRTVAKGDQYPPEISATAAMVMQQLKNGPNKRPNAYIMAWQSQVLIYFRHASHVSDMIHYC
jgi:ferrochelatase